MQSITSPDDQVQVEFHIIEDGEGRDIYRRCPAWRVRYRGRPVLVDSRLGLFLDGDPPLTTHFEIVGTDRNDSRTVWKPACGERARIVDHYNELTVRLRETISPHRTIILTFRAYDTGAAIRYTVPDQAGLERVDIWREETRFHFPDGCEGWITGWAQGPYERRAIESIGEGCEQPLLVKYSDGRWAAIGEAGREVYPRMKLHTDHAREHTLAAELGGNPRMDLPFSTPWRYVIVGDRPVDIPQRNDLILNLSPPCRIDDTSWIRPGKAIREMTLSTRGAEACVDFAVEHNLQHILFDGGWYGHPLDEATGATSVDPWEQKIGDPDQHEGLDLQQAIDYATDRDIGVWLYVDQHALSRQLDDLLPLYRDWGVAGIKFGFVHVGPQGWTRWLHEALRKCAEHRLMVDIHDEYRPTGLQRTYPNLVNVEGIGGNETFPPSGHNVTLPFTRFVAGMADYTICCYSPKLETRRTHQLAMAVCFFGPLQLLYWYDRPEQYGGEPELAFFDAVPTVWDETRILDGYPGEFVVTARRNGHDWFVGAMTNNQEREVNIDLGFLDRPGSATIYQDGGPGQNEVAIHQRTVDPSIRLQARMRPAGGYAAHVRLRS